VITTAVTAVSPTTASATTSRRATISTGGSAYRRAAKRLVRRRP
jgi:hypothetical protein